MIQKSGNWQAVKVEVEKMTWHIRSNNCQISSKSRRRIETRIKPERSLPREATWSLLVSCWYSNRCRSTLMSGSTRQEKKFRRWKIRTPRNCFRLIWLVLTDYQSSVFHIKIQRPIPITTRSARNKVTCGHPFKERGDLLPALRLRLVQVRHQADQPFEQLEDDLLEQIFGLRWSLLQEPFNNEIKSLWLWTGHVERGRAS